MATEAQILANRANAKKSTGPRTEAGKARARFNARRHGLTGHIFALASDDEAAFRRFERGYLRDLKPVGFAEENLVGLIATGYWRLGSTAADEQNMLSLRHEDFAEHTHADSEPFHAASIRARIAGTDGVPTNFPLYESRIRRTISQNEKRLAELQSARKAEEEQALQEAELLLKLAHFEGQPIQTTAQAAEIGSVFSDSRLHARLTRRITLARAEFYEKRDWRRDSQWPWRNLRVPPRAFTELKAA